LAFLEKSKQGKITLEKLVEKASHNVATLFNIDRRGFLREGYYADIVLVNPNASRTVTKESILYKCGWSPFEGETFSHRIEKTFVNGRIAYDNGKIIEVGIGERLTFNR
jgi:dihydroorotase